MDTAAVLIPIIENDICSCNGNTCRKCKVILAVCSCELYTRPCRSVIAVPIMDIYVIPVDKIVNSDIDRFYGIFRKLSRIGNITCHI